jgi:hypothetical protein
VSVRGNDEDVLRREAVRGSRLSPERQKLVNEGAERRRQEQLADDLNASNFRALLVGRAVLSCVKTWTHWAGMLLLGVATATAPQWGGWFWRWLHGGK